MNKQEINHILISQRGFFHSGATLPIDFRISMLKKLRETIIKNEKDILKALNADLGKSEYEGYMCEVGMVLSELTYMIKHTPHLAAKHFVKSPLAQFASVSYTKSVPYGNTLIMSPWNYPFLLSVDPLINAIAAGNTAIVKPSAYSPATAKIVEKIIKECFHENYVAVVLGGREENSHLLDLKFDFVFFTGSQAVGKEVLRHIAEHLTPSVLELGGKSPCIVDETAKIKLAAKRIVFGKYLNCGQTCVAPDYVWCHKDIKDSLVKEIMKQIKLQYGANPLQNPSYGKIINEKHFKRLNGLISAEKVIYGGEIDQKTLKIAPTVLSEVSWDDAIMQEEIFGPILPIMTYESLDEVYWELANRPKPLALYFFSENKTHIDYIMNSCSFGGGCINDTIIHLATTEMGFGGVGESGMGSYHGKVGFEAFSHRKSIVDKKTWMDLPMRYQPYKSKINEKLLRLFLK